MRLQEAEGGDHPIDGKPVLAPEKTPRPQKRETNHMLGGVTKSRKARHGPRERQLA